MQPEELAIWMPYHALLIAINNDVNEGADGLALPVERDTVGWGIRSFHLAIEHAISIQLLLAVPGPSHFGSAAALLRPLVESTIRGHFFAWCTLSAAEQERFQLNRISFDPESMCRRIRGTPDCDGIAGRLNDVWEEYGDVLHRYTHGDLQQLCRRGTASGDEIGLRRDPHDYVGVLRLAIFMSTLAQLGVFALARDDQLVANVERRLTELNALDDDYLLRFPPA